MKGNRVQTTHTRTSIHLPHPTPQRFFGALTLSTSTSSSSRLWLAIVIEFVSILPWYESRMRDTGAALPVACKMRSRSVDTRRLSGSSDSVTVVPFSFHSGFVSSLGSCTWSEIGY